MRRDLKLGKFLSENHKKDGLMREKESKEQERQIAQQDQISTEASGSVSGKKRGDNFKDLRFEELKNRNRGGLSAKNLSVKMRLVYKSLF